MRGDSECSTGQPMMPTSFVAPEIAVIGSQYLPATQPCGTHNAYASHTPRSSRSSRLVRSWPDDPHVMETPSSHRLAAAALAAALTTALAAPAPLERRRSSDSVRPGGPGGLAGQQPHRWPLRPSVLRRRHRRDPRRPPRLLGRRGRHRTRVPARDGPGARGANAAGSADGATAAEGGAERGRFVPVVGSHPATRSRRAGPRGSRGRRTRVRGSPSPGACGRRLTRPRARQQPP